jgi:hypothetical protein
MHVAVDCALVCTFVPFVCPVRKPLSNGFDNDKSDMPDIAQIACGIHRLVTTMCDCRFYVYKISGRNQATKVSRQLSYPQIHWFRIGLVLRLSRVLGCWDPTTQAACVLSEHQISNFFFFSQTGA